MQSQFPLYVLDGGTEQRVAVRFCFKAAQSAAEEFVLAKKDYGYEAVKRSKVFRWHSRFRDDNERGWRPKSTRKQVKNNAVFHFVKNDLRIASRMTAHSLNISKFVVLRILKENFGKKRYMHLFFHTTSHLSKGKIESYLAKALSRLPLEINFLNEIVTGDWTWCFAYDPKRKRHISEWVL